MTNPPKITALIHTRNESAFIDACLESVAWADEIVVADMASTDDTRAKALAKGARIVDMPVFPYVEPVRNQAVAACLGDWILVVDADERVMPKLAEALREVAADPKAEAYALPRRNYFYEEWMEHVYWPDYQTRFFRRGRVAWSGVIHEHPEVAGESAWLPADPQAALQHPGYFNDMQRALLKAINYGRHEQTRLKELNIVADWRYLLRRPAGEFFDRYFGGGWRHGMNGFVLCLMLANYQLGAALQCWEQQRRNQPVVEPRVLRRGVIYETFRCGMRALRRLLPG